MPTEGAAQAPEGETSEGEERSHVRILGLILAVLVLRLWLVPLSSSLWIDELLTWWVIKDGAARTIGRAFTYQQSPLYYLIVWLAQAIGGSSEMVLRLPSLSASIGSAVLLYRLVRRLVGREAARMSVLVFASTTVVAFEASEARPYAIATFALVAATFALVLWLDEGGWRRGVLYVVLAVAVVWMHYLFALALIPHAVYAIVRIRRRQTSLTPAHLVAAAVAIVVGLVPLALQIASLWDRRGSLSIPNEVVISSLLIVLVPTALSGALFLGVLLARTQGPVSLSMPRAQRSSLILFVSWLVIPSFTLFAISTFTPITLLAPRYFASVTPAVAALAGWALASVEPALARRFVIAVLALLSVLGGGGVLKNGEDWRGAAAFERANADAGTIVLLHPGLIESKQLDWFADPERLSYMTAVPSYYPMVGRVTLLPYVIDDPGVHAFMEGLVTSQLEGVDRFLLITRYRDLPYKDWLDGRLATDGFRSSVLAEFGLISVIEYQRDLSGVVPGST